jgi:hypothetical protein
MMHPEDIYAEKRADDDAQIDEGSHYQREAGWGTRNQCKECQKGYGGKYSMGPFS